MSLSQHRDTQAIFYLLNISVEFGSLKYAVCKLGDWYVAYQTLGPVEGNIDLVSFGFSFTYTDLSEVVYFVEHCS